MSNLEKARPTIIKSLKKLTNGEIIDYDIWMDFLTSHRPFYRIMLEVPKEVKEKYNNDIEEILNKHQDTFEQILTAAGFDKIFKTSIVWSIL